MNEANETYRAASAIAAFEASNIAARTRQTGDYAGADRVRHLDEYDRSSASFLLQRLGRRGRVRKDDLGT